MKRRGKLERLGLYKKLLSIDVMKIICGAIENTFVFHFFLHCGESPLFMRAILQVVRSVNRRLGFKAPLNFHTV